jgi:hypothetical protein
MAKISRAETWQKSARLRHLIFKIFYRGIFLLDKDLLQIKI